MKRTLLFLCALLTSLGMWAQWSDVTSTYITNPGFESCTETTTNAAATGSAAPLDIAGGWTQVNSAAWSSSAVVTYGGTGQVNGASAPSEDNAGNSGKTLGVSVGWGGLVTYKTANVTLPAGRYTLTIHAYNNLSGKTQFNSKFGFIASETSYVSTKNSFTYGTWVEDKVEFYLLEATEGYFQVGGQAVSGGSGENAKVFFDNITLTRNADIQNIQSLIDDGWSPVTDLSSMTLSNYYFIFLDGADPYLSMTRSGVGTDARPVYQLLIDPTESVGQVWMLENSGDNYLMKSYTDNWYYTNGSAGWNSAMVSPSNDDSKMTFTLSSGKYHINGPRGDGNNKALGAWNGYSLSGGGKGYAGTAGNKDIYGDDNKGFYIFSIPRASYTPAVNPSVNYAAAGWLPVKTTEGWGRDGFHYVFLDVSETGFETGMVMSATEDGLPQYQRSDMGDNTQVWTTEKAGDGYALKNVEYDKYSNYTAPWAGNMSSELPDKVFVPTHISDGKWKMKNTVDSGNWLGRWGDSDNGKNGKNDPFAGEELAANKGANAGQRYYLVYSIPDDVEVATALPVSGDMNADSWYFFDIDVAGSSYTATATTLADIQCISYSTGSGVTLKEKDNSFEATRYYVKSNTDNNLAIAAASYSYNVGSATSDVSYIQKNNIVTVSYNGLSTDDPNPGKTVDFSGVTFDGNTISVTPTDNGFTFTVPTVTAATEYTLYIPADAIGYTAGDTYNEEQEITLKTPAVFDGTYFFRVENEELSGEYLSAGADWGTHAAIDGNGFAIIVATDGQNKTTLKNYNFEAERYFRMDANGWDCWADRPENDDYSKFNLIPSNSPFDGKFFIHGITTASSNKYFKFDNADIHASEGKTKVWADSNGEDGENWHAIRFTADPLADGDDYAAMTSAITTAEAYTLGFEDGEYAPYNNISVLNSLAEAEAINTSADNPQSKIQGYTTALAAANWTANSGEVNAISWEDYTSGDIAGDGYIHPRGWTNTGYNTRIYSKAAGNQDTNTGISAVNDLAMMMKYNTTYGETEGYTMPLKAATVYKINFKYCGWGNTPTTNIVLTDPEDNDITVTPTSFRPTTNDGNTNASDWYDYTGYFVSTTAGDYVFAFNKVESGQQQIGIGDLELKKAPASYTANLKVNDGKLGTFIAPFDITLPANVKAYSATSDETTVTLTKIAEGGDELKAGTPVIIFGDGVSVDETFYGVPEITDNQTEGALTGILNEEEMTITSGKYVLQTQSGDQAFYRLDINATGKLNRCYVTANAGVGGARLVISIDDDPTAINAIEAAAEELDIQVDGKYFEDGKVVIVKNGVKYSANGQILK